MYWIGDADAARRLSTFEHQIPQTESLPEYLSHQELSFTHRFTKYLEEFGNSNVGGVAVNCLCSVYGHCYQNHAGAFSLDSIEIPDRMPVELRRSAERSGMGRFAYHLYSADERGVAVVGYYLEQAQIGYLHVPLERDDPLKVSARDQVEFRGIVVAAGQMRATGESQ
jgi:hypothetical protein